MVIFSWTNLRTLQAGSSVLLDVFLAKHLYCTVDSVTGEKNGRSYLRYDWYMVLKDTIFQVLKQRGG